MSKKEATTQVVKAKAPASEIQLVPTITSAESLISQAITNNTPVETMERLLAMRTQLKAEWAREEFNKAMANFQAECPTIVKTKEVKTRAGIVAYRYAPIESIVSQVAPYLQNNGFSYSTSMELKEAGVKVVVKVTHIAGHFEESPMEVPLGNKTDIMSQSQVVAAAQTFAKRYAFCNAFGILTGDEDTDARPEASQTPQNAPQTAKPANSAPKPAEAPKAHSDEVKLYHLCKMLGIDSRDKELTTKEIKVLTGLDLHKNKYPEIIERLEFLVKENSKKKETIVEADKVEEEVNVDDIPF